jgi:predicted dehydrogenase
MGYAGYALKHPEELAIVGVADPSPLRRRLAAERFGLTPDQCFESADQLGNLPKKADAAINGTMDHQHVPTCLPLLEAGYDILLEKPFATSEAEMWDLVKAARRRNRTIVICHVLRYTPFYSAIRQKVLDGAIGAIKNIQTLEHVSYHHMAVGFLRGKWSQKSYCGSSFLMAKCCHDLDLLAWMKSGVRPTSVFSYGSNFQFKPEDAPAGAGTRCLTDCPIEKDCLYSARKQHLDHPHRWSFYVWDSLEHLAEPTLEDKQRSLETDNPYGRCVWKCGTEMVDHQSVAIEFADGATATHNLVGGAPTSSRRMHLVGTAGEIVGEFESSRFTIRRPDPAPGREFAEETVDLRVGGDKTGAFGGHGGGDSRLVADFLRVLRGEGRSISTTSIEDSVNGHRIGFAADRALAERRVVELAEPTAG